MLSASRPDASGYDPVVSLLLSLMKDQLDFLIGRASPAARLTHPDRETVNRIFDDAKTVAACT
ncbi:MAG: hypothetical protein R2861_14110 [Desulfobacterales bacterium]